jgi:hypothetical protein
MDTFDPERFKLTAGAVGKARPKNRLPRHKACERFLRGPIPWHWLEAAGRLPGKTLHVAIALWLLAGIKRGRPAKWEPATAATLGVERHAAYRGLAALEAAGLIAVDRRNGRCPVVTMLERRM